jgi:nucleotide-binding universal stress UspA family protein
VVTVADVFLPPPLKPEDSFPERIPEAVREAHRLGSQKFLQAQEKARNAVEVLKRMFPEWLVSAEAQAGSPVWEIIRKADDWKPDLVVIGARGHSVFGGRLVLGSVSQRVLYEVKTSVRISRHPMKTPATPLLILIGVDNSTDSQAAVEAVRTRSWPKGTEVRLLAVVDTVMPVEVNQVEPALTKWIETGDEDTWGEVRDLFEPSAQKLRDSGLIASVEVRRGSPADEIVDQARTCGADCVFVGAKGVRGIERLLLGSVSAAVAAKAPCSVEVVRPV